MAQVPQEVASDLPRGVTLITGAAQGIGRTLALGLASRGHAVVISDINERGLGETAEQLRTNGFPAAGTYAVDLTEEESLGAMFDAIHTDVGHISGVVNNAGGTFGLRGVAIDETKADDWDRLVTMNLKTVYLVSKYAVALIKRQSPTTASIVNMASESGRHITRTRLQAYAAAKSAVIGLTRQLAFELGPIGIRVNALAPGLILSSEAKASLYGVPLAEGDPREAEVASNIPLRRFGRPDDLVGVTGFLLGDDSRYITGQTILVNGGFTFG